MQQAPGMRREATWGLQLSWYLFKDDDVVHSCTIFLCYLNGEIYEIDDQLEVQV